MALAGRTVRPAVSPGLQVPRQRQPERGETADAQERPAGHAGAIAGTAGAKVEHGSVRPLGEGGNQGTAGTPWRVSNTIKNRRKSGRMSTENDDGERQSDDGVPLASQCRQFRLSVLACPATCSPPATPEYPRCSERTARCRRTSPRSRHPCGSSGPPPSGRVTAVEARDRTAAGSAGPYAGQIATGMHVPLRAVRGHVGGEPGPAAPPGVPAEVVARRPWITSDTHSVLLVPSAMLGDLPTAGPSARSPGSSSPRRTGTASRSPGRYVFAPCTSRTGPRRTSGTPGCRRWSRPVHPIGQSTW